MSHDEVCSYHYRGISRAWLTAVTVWLYPREGVAKCPCKCGSKDGIYNNHPSKTNHGQVPLGIWPLVFLRLFSSGQKFLVIALLHFVRPGHQGFQSFVGRRLAEVGQHRQCIEQVVVRVNSVGFRRFHQRIHNRTGLCSFDRVAEQPVLSVMCLRT